MAAKAQVITRGIAALMNIEIHFLCMLNLPLRFVLTVNLPTDLRSGIDSRDRCLSRGAGLEWRSREASTVKRGESIADSSTAAATPNKQLR